MESRIQLIAVLATVAMLLIVLELVRRRRFLERYAVLWLFAAAVLIGLSVWSNLLETLASGVGIKTPVNALFVVAFGFVALLLLHFSLAVSRLHEQSKVLAQRLAMAQQRISVLEGRQGEDAGDPAVDSLEETGVREKVST
jgi:hypothetical protein